ncbi:hypothetical protein [Clostridium sp. CF012]|uniref:hypothetical protein n=1 Tax=Clostridium sp. CF012 TaxID=2843319 RepID=UPI001C0D48F1|nr:hypothetical protein [Clostridium sp. CF012]MBU3142217.1 hypothetical protein [Clostridium sp. CF012]
MADSQLSQQLKDLQLLEKHLTKMYEKEGLSHKEALKIAQKTIDSEQNIFGFKGLAWLVASQDLEYFCLYFLSNIYVPTEEEIIKKSKAKLSKIHIEIWHELEDMVIKKDYNQRNYICPRSFGKTSCISTPLAIWCACYKFKDYIVIASAVEDTAASFLKNIGNALTNNKLIEKAFGKLTDKKKLTFNSSVIELTNTVKIESVSASSASRGKNDNFTRIDLLIMDDFQKDDEVSTDESREKKWKLYNDSLKNATQANTSIMLSVGTIQHKECFYSRILNTRSWKSTLKKCILLDDIDEYFNTGLWEEFYKIYVNSKDENSLLNAKDFYYLHEPEMQYPMLWNEFWNCLDIAIKYFESPVSFKQEYQNDVNNIGEKRFKTTVTESPKEIELHKFLKSILVIDPAKTRTKTSGNKKDYFAFAICSLGDNKIKYIRKGEIHKFRKDLEFEDYLKHTLGLLRLFKDVNFVSAEKLTYGGADILRLQELIKEDVDLNHRNIKFEMHGDNKSKDDRINTIVPAVNLGQVVFNEEDSEAIEQLREFAGTRYTIHDDFVDSVAQACKMIDEIKTTQYIKFDTKFFL